jgi:anti-sigma B factor antagonist
MSLPDATPPFRIDGELTIYRAAELAAALKAAFAALADGADLEVDLADVTEMDCAGVQLLIAAGKTARAGGRALRLSGHSPVVLEVFQTLHLAACLGEPTPPPAATH